MATYKVTFSECEHDGDLDNYKTDIINSGGKIVDSGVDHENEVGWVRFETDDKDAFMTKFRETDAYGFM
jgi:hypothetical protein